MSEKTKKSLKASKMIWGTSYWTYDGFNGNLSKLSFKIEQDLDKMEKDFKDLI
jgi:hypothetical protein